MGNGSTISVWEERTRRWQAVADAVSGGMTRAEASRRYGMSERTVYRILGRRNRQGRVRRAQPPGPRPGNGPGRTSPAMVQLVCDCRREHPQKGHHHCHHYLKRLGHSPPSPATIWRLWRRHRLLGKKRRRQNFRARWELRRQAPGFFQLDTMYLPGNRFAFVAIDTCSRFGYLEISETRDARRAAAFLLHLLDAFPATVTGLQTDRGSEFYGDFHKLAASLNLPHFFAWTQCPDLNGMVERFIRTIRDESLLDTAEPDTPSAVLIQDAQDFLHHYNHHRLHSRLDYRPPFEYLSLYTTSQQSNLST
jgi:transposase InsO family protein